MVAQNAADLREEPGYVDLLDAQAQEQVFFDGAADVSGDDPRQGDCRLPLFEGDAPPEGNPSYCDGIRTLDMSSEEYVWALADYLAAGIPVLRVDYALEEGHAAFAYAQDEHLHFVGLVTMRSPALRIDAKGGPCHHGIGRGCTPPPTPAATLLHDDGVDPSHFQRRAGGWRNLVGDLATAAAEVAGKLNHHRLSRRWVPRAPAA